MALHKKVLSPSEVEEVKVFMRKHEINTFRFRRAYSDVYPVAEILKEYYPKIIELNHYPKRNGYQLKLFNWETFNSKVLHRVGVNASSQFLSMLANGTPGAVEILFFEFIKLEKKARDAVERQAIQRQERKWEEKNEIKFVDVEQKSGEHTITVRQKMILYTLYEEMARSCEAKENMIEKCKVKIQYLENLCKLKTERIATLQAQIAKLPSEIVSISSMSDSNLALTTNFENLDLCSAQETQSLTSAKKAKSSTSFGCMQ